MEEFLKKVMKGFGIDPPEVCVIALYLKFPGAINPEWHQKGEHFEVVFHRNAIECIADFDATGRLIKYKMNLEEDLLPSSVRDALLQRGEIMNTVLINEGSHLNYEVILRNKDLQRSMILLDHLGVVIRERLL